LYVLFSSILTLVAFFDTWFKVYEDLPQLVDTNATTRQQTTAQTAIKKGQGDGVVHDIAKVIMELLGGLLLSLALASTLFTQPFIVTW
jgi:hypothetical protein